MFHITVLILWGTVLLSLQGQINCADSSDTRKELESPLVYRARGFKRGGFIGRRITPLERPYRITTTFKPTAGPSEALVTEKSKIPKSRKRNNNRKAKNILARARKFGRIKQLINALKKNKLNKAPSRNVKVTSSSSLTEETTTLPSTAETTTDQNTEVTTASTKDKTDTITPTQTMGTTTGETTTASQPTEEPVLESINDNIVTSRGIETTKEPDLTEEQYRAGLNTDKLTKGIDPIDVFVTEEQAKEIIPLLVKKHVGFKILEVDADETDLEDVSPVEQIPKITEDQMNSIEEAYRSLSSEVNKEMGKGFSSKDRILELTEKEMDEVEKAYRKLSLDTPTKKEEKTDEEIEEKVEEKDDKIKEKDDENIEDKFKTQKSEGSSSVKLVGGYKLNIPSYVQYTKDIPLAVPYVSTEQLKNPPVDLTLPKQLGENFNQALLASQPYIATKKQPSFYPYNQVLSYGRPSYVANQKRAPYLLSQNPYRVLYPFGNIYSYGPIANPNIQNQDQIQFRSMTTNQKPKSQDQKNTFDSTNRGVQYPYIDNQKLTYQRQNPFIVNQKRKMPYVTAFPYIFSPRRASPYQTYYPNVANQKRKVPYQMQYPYIAIQNRQNPYQLRYPYVANQKRQNPYQMRYPYIRNQKRQDIYPKQYPYIVNQKRQNPYQMRYPYIANQKRQGLYLRQYPHIANQKRQSPYQMQYPYIAIQNRQNPYQMQYPYIANQKRQSPFQIQYPYQKRQDPYFSIINQKRQEPYQKRQGPHQKLYPIVVNQKRQWPYQKLYPLVINQKRQQPYQKQYPYIVNQKRQEPYQKQYLDIAKQEHKSLYQPPFPYFPIRSQNLYGINYPYLLNQKLQGSYKMLLPNIVNPKRQSSRFKLYPYLSTRIGKIPYNTKYPFVVNKSGQTPYQVQYPYIANQRPYQQQLFHIAKKGSPYPYQLNYPYIKNKYEAQPYQRNFIQLPQPKKIFIKTLTFPNNNYQFYPRSPFQSFPVLQRNNIYQKYPSLFPNIPFSSKQHSISSKPRTMKQNDNMLILPKDQVVSFALKGVPVYTYPEKSNTPLTSKQYSIPSKPVTVKQKDNMLFLPKDQVVSFAMKGVPVYLYPKKPKKSYPANPFCINCEELSKSEQPTLRTLELKFNVSKKGGKNNTLDKDAVKNTNTTKNNATAKDANTVKTFKAAKDIEATVDENNGNVVNGYKSLNNEQNTAVDKISKAETTEASSGTDIKSDSTSNKPTMRTTQIENTDEKPINAREKEELQPERREYKFQVIAGKTGKEIPAKNIDAIPNVPLTVSQSQHRNTPLGFINNRPFLQSDQINIPSIQRHQTLSAPSKLTARNEVFPAPGYIRNNQELGNVRKNNIAANVAQFPSIPNLPPRFPVYSEQRISASEQKRYPVYGITSEQERPAKNRLPSIQQGSPAYSKLNVSPKYNLPVSAVNNPNIDWLQQNPRIYSDFRLPPGLNLPHTTAARSLPRRPGLEVNRYPSIQQTPPGYPSDLTVPSRLYNIPQGAANNPFSSRKKFARKVTQISSNNFYTYGNNPESPQGQLAI